MRQQLINEAVSLYKKTLNPSSKFYNDDLSNFKRCISAETTKGIQQRIANLSAFVNPKSKLNKTADREIKRMDRAGMFNVANLNAKNALS